MKMVEEETIVSQILTIKFMEVYGEQKDYREVITQID
jgi:hypothetical protein